MKRIFASKNSAELGALENVLGTMGIRCVVRGDAVATDPSAIQRELWIGRDADYLRAQGVCDRWRHPSTDRASYWTCGGCGAGSEDRFSSCWKCGADRDASA
jgi:hypothetical protein